MSRHLLYMAAPLRPNEEEIAAVPQFTTHYGSAEYEPDVRVPFSKAEIERMALRANLDRAMRWLAWLRRSFPETTFIAPRIASVLADNGEDPAQREAGFVDDCAVIERCDGIVLVGGRISEGMRREMEHGQGYFPRSLSWPFEVYDLTRWCGRLYGGDPPRDTPIGIPTWAAMFDRFRAEWTA